MPKTKADKSRGSLLELLYAAYDADPEMRSCLFGAVSDHIRSCLASADAPLVASWFDRLAQGHDPRDVFLTRRTGRPKGAVKHRKSPDGFVPDDYDVAAHVRWARDWMPAEKAYAVVAKHFDMETGTFRNIWTKLKGEFAPIARK